MHERRGLEAISELTSDLQSSAPTQILIEDQYQLIVCLFSGLPAFLRHAIQQRRDFPRHMRPCGSPIAYYIEFFAFRTVWSIAIANSDESARNKPDGDSSAKLAFLEK
jgi:hypothetical protein